MAAYTPRLLPAVVARVEGLSQRDRAIVAENFLAVLEDPHQAGRPTDVQNAKQHAWRHKCPHSFVVVYRWDGGDPEHPPGIVTFEKIVDCYS